MQDHTTRQLKRTVVPVYMLSVSVCRTSASYFDTRNNTRHKNSLESHSLEHNQITANITG